MELKITNPATRVLLERSDNGMIAYEINEENVVVSKLVYSLYFKDGLTDFESIANLMVDTLEILKVPLEEVETNRKMMVVITKLDPEKPALGQNEEDE